MSTKLYQNIIKVSVVLVTVIIISILLIKRFIYFRPSSVMLPYKETYKDVSNGNIHGWFVKGKNGKVVLYCHGNAGNISNRQEQIDAFVNMGYSVMIFDYSGYGRSQGIPSETQLYHDASGFLQLLYQKKIEKLLMSVVGIMQGG